MLVETYRQICRRHPLADAVVALYVYEAQVPEIASTKIEGLRAHFGITGKNGLAYFAVHQEADQRHRAAWRDWLNECFADPADDVAAGRAVATAETALRVLWAALDAIEQASIH